METFILYPQILLGPRPNLEDRVHDQETIFWHMKPCLTDSAQTILEKVTYRIFFRCTWKPLYLDARIFKVIDSRP